MQNLYIPKNYKSTLDLAQTQYFIKEIKDFFQYALSRNLDLLRVSAPLFVREETGLNDNLSGKENAVNFSIRQDEKDIKLEIVHSLAKWKRYALHRYNIPKYKGIYADMNAIRSFEDMDNIHSMYVDQWDWEKVIDEKDRNKDYLKETVKIIFKTLKDLDYHMRLKLKDYKSLLPEEITFITSQQLEDLYPNLSPKERELEIVREKKAVFIMEIGSNLKSGSPHDNRSPDYDDWKLNGDIIVYNPVLDDALELSSMGIRVSPKSLQEQLEISGNLDRLSRDYHKSLINGKLPFTIGGGIGQSRLCMFFLQKAHIGEVQVSVWPDEMVEECSKNGIILL